MPGVSTTAINRYSYSSSYPSYRPSSSYLNRTTSLDRSAYGIKTSSTPSYSSYGSSNDYSYTSRYSSGLPPKPSYSTSTDTFRNSRSLRVSPARPTNSRLSDINGSLSDLYSHSRLYGSNKYRETSDSRDSGYSSRYSSKDRMSDVNANDYTRIRRSVEKENNNRIRVSDRIKTYDSIKSDPIEQRLAERRRRLGLSPVKDLTRSTYSRYKIEENNNDKIYRRTIPDTSKYSSKYNGILENKYELTGGSGGSSYSYKDINGRSSPVKSFRSRNNSSDEKYTLPDSKSVKRSSPKPITIESEKREYRASSPSLKLDTSNSLRPLSLKETIDSKTKERRQRAKDRLSARLATDYNDEEIGSRKSRTSSGSSFNENDGLVGLRNIGNTCFLNSITQCLSNTPCLLEYLLREGYTSDVNTTLATMKGDLVRAFANLLSDMWTNGSDKSPINTGPFKNEVQRFAPTFIGYAQHDAQEFLRKLLEGLHEDVNRVTVRPKPITDDIDDSLDDNQKAIESWKRYLRYDDSKIVDMFVGQLKSSLQCSVCNHRSVTFDPFWDLSLPIPNKVSAVKLSQCLDLFTKEEVLDNNERPTCSRCKERRRMTKSFNIHKFPKVLVLHLKRFSPTERWRGKLGCNIEFPVDGLDLSKYAASPNISCQYRLFGVANHSGTALSGHYTAYCRHPYTRAWHEYNDSRVSNMSSDRVCSPEAYVLFYELTSS